MPDNFVDCCVTSPPFFGLRDYNTGTWHGGDPNCSHVVGSQVQGTKSSHGGGVRPGCDATTCKVCGATRVDQQIGLETTATLFVDQLVTVFEQVRRVLKPTGTLLLNLGDSYAGSGKGAWRDPKVVVKEAYKPTTTIRGDTGYKPKDLMGIPWLVALALQKSGYYLRTDLVWAKGVSGQNTLAASAYRAARREGLDRAAATRVANAVDPFVGNAMPSSVQDRPSRSHDYVFLLTKSSRYYWNKDEVAEVAVTGKLRNMRSVLTVNTQPYRSKLGHHFASFPVALIKPLVLAACPVGGVVLDPFAGTVGHVAVRNHRRAVLLELNPDYLPLILERCV